MKSHRRVFEGGDALRCHAGAIHQAERAWEQVCQATLQAGDRWMFRGRWRSGRLLRALWSRFLEKNDNSDVCAMVGLVLGDVAVHTLGAVSQRVVALAPDRRIDAYADWIIANRGLDLNMTIQWMVQAFPGQPFSWAEIGAAVLSDHPRMLLGTVVAARRDILFVKRLHQRRLAAQTGENKGRLRSRLRLQSSVA